MTENEVSRGTAFPTRLLKKTDQSAHPHSLIRIFAGLFVGSQGSEVFRYTEKTAHPVRMHRQSSLCPRFKSLC